MELVVSIINFRTAELTCACIDSVVPQARNLDAKIVIVDNASGDGSDDVIEEHISQNDLGDQVMLIRSPSNEGFSGGHNQAISAIEAAFYFVLNSDAIIRDGCLAELLEKARIQPKTGLFAPRLEHEDGTVQTSCFRTPGPLSELIRAANTGAVTKLFRGSDQPLPHPHISQDIGWVSFAAVLLRRETIEDIGQMDEGYFLYFEDTDYCVQATRGGWGIEYVPNARVVHFRGGSAPVKTLHAARKRLPAYYYASRSRVMYKTHGWLGLLAANLLWHFGRGIAAIRPLLGASYPRANANEGRDIWTNFLSPLGDRRAPKGS